MSNTVQGDVGTALPRLMEYLESQGIRFEYSEKISPARGMSYGGLIRVLPDLPASETLSTVVHELAHEMLHKAERRTLTTKTIRETEAEAVAFVVCDALGLQTGTGSAITSSFTTEMPSSCKRVLKLSSALLRSSLGPLAPGVRSSM